MLPAQFAASVLIALSAAQSAPSAINSLNVIASSTVLPRAVTVSPGQLPTTPTTATFNLAARPMDHTPLPHELTSTDLEVFLDGVVPAQLLTKDMAGVVITVVKDGRLLLAKGYGYADVSARRPVSPTDTLFRPGSISKLFTWTAVMQLVEEGKLELDRDVNDYLNFKIPNTFPAPITLRNLMTHTGGFEESLKDLSVSNRSDLQPLGDYLATHVPRRLYAPGTVPAYSNYGGSLAGYIVQRVSGQPFNSYVAEHIFKPLGMNHSTFDEALPESLAPLMSRGYLRASQGPRSVEILQAGPSGSLASTAGDMARFMIAHLQDGRYENEQILKSDTARVMHARQFALNPAINALTLGFYEQSRNGHRIIGHGGDSVCFVSELYLIVDAGVGFFVSYNSQGRDEDEQSPELLWRSFLDRYFPFEIPDVDSTATAQMDARSVRGMYLSSRRSDASLLKLAGVLQEVKVTAQADGTILTEPPFAGPDGDLTRWREVAPMLYRAVGGQDEIAFRRDQSGRMMILRSGSPTEVFQSATGTQTKAFLVAAIFGSGGTFLLAFAAWPATALLRRRQDRSLRKPLFDRRLRAMVRLFCALDLGLMILWGEFLAYTLSSGLTGFDLTPLSHRFDVYLHILQVLSLIGALGLLTAAWSTSRLWSDPDTKLRAKLWEMVVVAAFGGFVWLLISYNLANFDSRY
jgi:CubicO group peptidase (beta-lactamase class C family)